MPKFFANAMMHSYRPPLLSNWSEYPNAKFQTSSGVQFSQNAVPSAFSLPHHSSSTPYQFPNIEQSNYDAMKYSYNPRNTQGYGDRAEESKNNHFSRDILLLYEI